MHRGVQAAGSTGSIAQTKNRKKSSIYYLDESKNLKKKKKASGKIRKLNIMWSSDTGKAMNCAASQSLRQRASVLPAAGHGSH